MNASLWGRRLIKAAVALGITGYLLWLSDPSAVAAATAAADWRWIAGAVALVLFDRALNAWRWIALLDTGDSAPVLPTSRLLYIFFVSTFIGTFLPASGDLVVRAWQISREQLDRVHAVASVIMDRLLGVVGLVAVVSAGLALGRQFLAPQAWTAGIVLSLFTFTVAVAVVYSNRLETLLHRMVSILPETASRPSSKVLRAVRAYATRHATVTGVLTASIVVNILRVLQAWMLGRAVGMAPEAVVYFCLVPLILLLMLLPISVAGLGVSQAGFVGFFQLVGVPPAQSFALSILYVALGALGNLPGAVLYLFGGPRPDAATTTHVP